jgi:hypothetical protein
MGKSKKICIIFLLTIFLFQASSVFALEIKYPPVPGAQTPQEIQEKLKAGEISQEDTLPLYFKYFFNLSLIIITIICVGVLIYGGTLYLTSIGKPVVLVSARKWINSALLGLLILFSSYLVLYAINPQLTILRLPGKKGGEISGPEKLPEYLTLAEYTEIPLGQLIEQKILSPEAEKNFASYLAAVEAVRTKSSKLKQKLQELQKLTAACTCGKSRCYQSVEIGIDRTRCYCQPEHPQCAVQCDKEAIKNKIEEIKGNKAKGIKGALEELIEASKVLKTAQQKISKDYFDLKKATMAIDLGEDIADYYTFLPLEYLIEKRLGKEVTTIPFIASWPEVRAEVKSYVGEIESQAGIAKEASEENATSVDSILINTEAIKNEVGSLNKEIDRVKEKIEKALEGKGSINQALNEIEGFIKYLTSVLDKIQAINSQISDSAQQLKSADYQKSNIVKTSQEIEKTITEKGGTKENLSKIETLKEQIVNSGEETEKLDKLSKISDFLVSIKNQINSIWYQKEEIIDPATFYLPTQEAERILHSK